MNWVLLVILIHSSGSGVAIATAYFHTRDLCEAARIAAVNAQPSEVTAFCAATTLDPIK